MKAFTENESRLNGLEDLNSDQASCEKLKTKPHDIGRLLTRSLAAYLILRSKEPVSEVMQDLFEIERDAAFIVDDFFSNPEGTTKIFGHLNSAFSFISVGGGKSPSRDVTSSVRLSQIPEDQSNHSQN